MNRPTAPAVDHKQQEATETSTSVGMPAAAIVIMNKYDADIDVHDSPDATAAAPAADHPLERPTNLSLPKQEASSLTDALNIPSPTSPISKQVS